MMLKYNLYLCSSCSAEMFTVPHKLASTHTLLLLHVTWHTGTQKKEDEAVKVKIMF
jgi:hypothetical protein